MIIDIFTHVMPKRLYDRFDALPKRFGCMTSRIPRVRTRRTRPAKRRSDGSGFAAMVSPTGIEFGPIGLPSAAPPVVRNSDASWPMTRRLASCGKGQSRSSVATPACR